VSTGFNRKSVKPNAWEDLRITVEGDDEFRTVRVLVAFKGEDLFRIRNFKKDFDETHETLSVALFTLLLALREEPKTRATQEHFQRHSENENRIRQLNDPSPPGPLLAIPVRPPEAFIQRLKIYSEMAKLHGKPATADALARWAELEREAKSIDEAFAARPAPAGAS
jgi:hypothetical protein